jgi:hypothetical protein
MRKALLYIGGTITLCFALFHLSFWKLFNWQEELVKLSPENQGIMQMLNVVSVYTVLFAAFISFYLARVKVFLFLEKAVIIFIAGYYLLRIAFGIPLFGFSIQELIVWIFCFIMACCYLLALRQPR